MAKSLRIPILLIAAIPFYFYLFIWIISLGKLFAFATYLVTIVFLVIAILIAAKNKTMNNIGLFLSFMIALLWMYMGINNDKFYMLETYIGIFFFIFYLLLYWWQRKSN